ncbi:MAG TPA: hypothetical protein VF691_02645 [Cytophagaceae bacterium]
MRFTFKYFLILFFACGLFSAETVYSQDKKKEKGKAVDVKETESQLHRDSIPKLDLTPDSTEEVSKKKDKKKKKVFYGLKCKKGFTKTGKRKKLAIETFYYLKEFKFPDPYVKDIYVFEIKTRKIVEIDELQEKDKNKYKVLHGPYKRTVGDQIVEQGIFYLGMKHGRWEKYGKNFILMDKTKYYKGWQRDAEMTYYDLEKKKIQEVKPYKYGTLNGTYYYFLENGQILQHGKYKDDVKIGLWVEYYKDKARRRKETQYPRDPYVEDQFEPFVLNEWDDEGNPLIKNGKPFDRTKIQKKVPVKRGQKAVPKKAEPKVTAPTNEKEQASGEPPKKPMAKEVKGKEVQGKDTKTKKK